MTTGQKLAAQRVNIIRKIRRMTKDSYGNWLDAATLIEWIKTMDERYNRRPGGIGR